GGNCERSAEEGKKIRIRGRQLRGFMFVGPTAAWLFEDIDGSFAVRGVIQKPSSHYGAAVDDDCSSQMVIGGSIGGGKRGGWGGCTLPAVGWFDEHVDHSLSLIASDLALLGARDDGIAGDCDGAAKAVVITRINISELGRFRHVGPAGCGLYENVSCAVRVERAAGVRSHDDGIAADSDRAAESETADCVGGRKFGNLSPNSVGFGEDIGAACELIAGEGPEDQGVSVDGHRAAEDVATLAV